MPPHVVQKRTDTEPVRAHLLLVGRTTSDLISAIDSERIKALHSLVVLLLRMRSYKQVLPVLHAPAAVGVHLFRHDFSEKCRN